MRAENQFFKKNSIMAKALIIGVLSLLMLIPVGMVKSLVKEREQNKTVVQEEITTKWGGQQQLTGPILVLPYIKEVARGTQVVKEYAYFLPEEYNVNGDIKPQERSRGIYNILCYQADMKVNGYFNFPEFEKLNLKANNIQWDDAFIMIGVPYLQGIKNKLVFNVNGKSQEVIASVESNDLLSSGLTVKIPLQAEDHGKQFKFDFDLSLNGSGGLYFAPIGKQTSVNIKSSYNSATFIGEFLPNSRKIDQSGFDAQWDIFDYNRNYAQMWKGANPELKESRLGVDLLLPVDHYQKNMRSAKYAILFIALTFLVFFIVELRSHKHIHPVQYLLVSFALVLFYSLLLAFSEHIGFDYSYMISAVAIVVLITAYSHSIFKNKKHTLFMGGFLTALYSFLYVVIQLEDMSLLLGSIGLFVTLALVMYASRKVNWYKEEEKTVDPEVIG